jgi:hypothetical protein|tara:strand:+ start:273 stop:569 length:297 start_codon:yes stop_codon:yes gene_type:complete
MKKFFKIYNTIVEQDEVPVEEVPVQDIPIEEPQIETLSPESEVLLVRLLKKALVTEINPEDVDTVSALNDINEVNAKDTLTMLINVMKKYSTDIDIET